MVRKDVPINTGGSEVEKGEGGERACSHKENTGFHERHMTNRLTFLVEIPLYDNMVLAVEEKVGPARLAHCCIDVAAITIAVRVFRERSRPRL